MEFTIPASISQAFTLQKHLRAQVRLYDDFSSLLWIGAVDVSYSKKTRVAYATLGIFRLPALKVEAVYYNATPISFPYVPGLLAFREIPALLPLFAQLDALPDLLLVDGQGIAHPRQLGIASHLGVILDIPTIGCAKSRLVGSHRPVAAEKGRYEWLFYKNRIVGAVLRSRTNIRPLYISPGHRVAVPTAVSLVQRWILRTRLPFPLQFVDRETKLFRQRSEADT